MRHLIMWTVLFGILAGSIAPAAADKRVALVIGNGAYRNATTLANPVNDGRAVADVLRRLGFDVLEGIDEDKAGMQVLLRQFAAELENADVSLFFYAGHGLQVQRRNYLVPIDAALQSEVDLPFEAVAVDVVLDLMEQTTPLRLVFLDACRDNPLARRLALSSGKSRSVGVGRGLARMNNSVGTLIAFATEPDKVALDGEGEHSPFTEALLEHIDTPGIEVRQMLSRVRGTVIDHTHGEQLPLDTSALVDDFYFIKNEPAPEPAVASAPAGASPAAAASDNSTEHLFWGTIQSSTDPNDFQAYLARYPDGAFAPLARNRLAVLGARPQTEVAALTPTRPIAPEPAPQPAPQAVPPAPVPQPAAEIEVEPIDTTMVATRNVNLRGEPNTDHDPVGVVLQGAEVAVVGKVIGANWYRIQRPDGGGEAYVFAPLFEPPAAVVAAPATPAAPAAPAVVATRNAPSTAPAQAAEAKPPAAPVQVAAVTPGVASAGANTQATRAIDPAALFATLGERGRHAMLRFNYRVKGEVGSDFVAFDRWDDVAPGEDGPAWKFADASQTRVQSSSAAFGQAIRAVQVTPELFGVLMFSQATYGGRASFSTQRAADALNQWTFLSQHNARVQSKSSLVFDGVQFEIASLTLGPDAPASSCLGFVAIQVNKRADGFVCKTQGPAFEASQASAVLSQVYVPRFIEP